MRVSPMDPRPSGLGYNGIASHVIFPQGVVAALHRIMLSRTGRTPVLMMAISFAEVLASNHSAWPSPKRTFIPSPPWLLSGS